MIQTPSGGKRSYRWDGLALSRYEIIRWGLLIALPLVGTLLLVLCFRLHGIFTALGPWVIFVGAKLIATKIEKYAKNSNGRA